MDGNYPDTYEMDFDSDFPFLFSVEDVATGLRRYTLKKTDSVFYTKDWIMAIFSGPGIQLK